MQIYQSRKGSWWLPRSAIIVIDNCKGTRPRLSSCRGGEGIKHLTLETLESRRVKNTCHLHYKTLNYSGLYFLSCGFYLSKRKIFPCKYVFAVYLIFAFKSNPISICGDSYPPQIGIFIKILSWHTQSSPFPNDPFNPFHRKASPPTTMA